jgi:hypothetical protein
MERQETFRLLGNLPWRRPAGPSWPLKADRKVTPHGQVLPRRNYVYGLTAKTSMRSESVHHCMCPIFHAAAGRRGQKRRAQSALTRCASLHVPRFPHGSDAVSKDARAVTVKFASVVAGNCLFDMASKGCGQKDTQSEQALLSGDRSPTHEVTNRDCHMPLTTHFFYDTYPVLNGQFKICLLHNWSNHCSQAPSFEKQKATSWHQ